MKWGEKTAVTRLAGAVVLVLCALLSAPAQRAATQTRDGFGTDTKADSGNIGQPPYGSRGDVEWKAAPPPSNTDADVVTDVKVLDDEDAPALPGADTKTSPSPQQAPPEPATRPAAVPAVAPAGPATRPAAVPAVAPAGPATQPAAVPAVAPAEPAAQPAAAPAMAPTEPATAQPTTAEPSSTPPSTVPRPPDVHEKTETKTPSLLTQRASPRKSEWEALHGGYTASRFAVARRLTERPTALLTRTATLPTQPRAFLWRVALDTWRGLQALTDKESGLPIDNVHFKGTSLPPLSLQVGDYTNITNIGLQFASIAAARALGLLPDDEARAGAVRLLDTLTTLRTYNGYFFNYYDTTSLEPTSSFISFVDTSWLVAGLLITRQAFPVLAPTINQILAPIDFAFFYDKSDQLMSHGYYVNLHSLSTYKYGAFYTEARLGSLIAIGKGDAPLQHWYAMRRAFRPRCSGESDCPDLHELAYTARDGHRVHVHYFTWHDHRYVPSWGGSMFEALMPRLVLDEAHWAPYSLGPNGEAHAVVQELYARDVLHLPVWGMSPCLDPDTGRYGEFGVPVLGSHGYSPRIVAPYAAALALTVEPDDAVANLMQIARRYDIYGEYGFYDAVNPATGKVAYAYLALDQAMLFLAVANHLSGGAVQDLFMADPYIRPVLSFLYEDRFFQ